jgi:hypothetical protein
MRSLYSRKTASKTVSRKSKKQTTHAPSPGTVKEANNACAITMHDGNVLTDFTEIREAAYVIMHVIMVCVPEKISESNL